METQAKYRPYHHLPPALACLPIHLWSAKLSVAIITFFAYTSFHASRKINSVVKSTLHPEKSTAHHSGWSPFNHHNGKSLLGYMDLAFLSFYAIGMYVMGYVGDRMDLRLFLTGGMILSGVSAAMIGFAQIQKIHKLLYFIILQALAGFFQSSGWPAVVAVMGNWYERDKRGLILGIWNSHTSVGNIVGLVAGAAVLKWGWDWSYFVTSAILIFVGIVAFFFLIPSPACVQSHQNSAEDEDDSMSRPLIQDSLSNQNQTQTEKSEKSVGFVEAWMIPGVAYFAFVLFFSKLVAYTFLYWLPYYVEHNKIDGHKVSKELASYLSTIFDVGGIFGGTLAGYLSDRSRASACTCLIFIVLSFGALAMYQTLGSFNFVLNLSLLFFCGFCVNAPYANITTAVSADLGTHESLRGNSRALATVTAIIDGTGSVGAAIGPALTGVLSSYSWGYVFVMLYVSCGAAFVLLIRLAILEIRLNRTSKA